jgi:cyanate permease
MLAAVTRGGETRGRAGLALHAVRGLFRRETMLIADNFIAFSATNLIVMAFLPMLLVDEFAMTPTDATLVSFFAALTLVPGNIAAGWLLDKGYDARTLFLISFCGMLAAAFFLLSDWPPQGYRIASAFLFSACTGVPPALVWSSIPSVMRTPDEAPLLSGFYYQGAGLGQLIGPILAGIAVEDFGGWFSAFWIILALMLAAIVFSAMMPPRR